MDWTTLTLTDGQRTAYPDEWMIGQALAWVAGALHPECVMTKFWARVVEEPRHGELVNGMIRWAKSI